MNSPVPLASEGLHIPPVSGVPPRIANRSTGEPLPQNVTEPLVPALGGGVIVTITVAVASLQGGVPVVVYV